MTDQILDYLTLSELCALQRVCKSHKMVVDSSGVWRKVARLMLNEASLAGNMSAEDCRKQVLRVSKRILQPERHLYMKGVDTGMRLVYEYMIFDDDKMVLTTREFTRRLGNYIHGLKLRLYLITIF